MGELSLVSDMNNAAESTGILSYSVYDADPATGGTEFELDQYAPDPEDYDDPQELLQDALDWATAEADNCGYGPDDHVWVTVDGPHGIELARGSREVSQ